MPVLEYDGSAFFLASLGVPFPSDVPSPTIMPDGNSIIKHTNN